jgi:hypothetical protein
MDYGNKDKVNVAHGKQGIRQYYLEYTIRSGVIVNTNSKRLFNPRLGAVQYRHQDMYIFFNRFRGQLARVSLGIKFTIICYPKVRCSPARASG